MFAGREVEMKFSTKVKSILYGMEFTHGMRRKLMGSLALVYFIYLGFNLVAITTLFATSLTTKKVEYFLSICITSLKFDKMENYNKIYYYFFGKIF